jgi:hypothetical protein
MAITWGRCGGWVNNRGVLSIGTSLGIYSLYNLGPSALGPCRCSFLIDSVGF